MADPGFPVGGGVHPLGGHGPPTWALFGENVCENETIGSHRGGACAGHAPLDPPMLYISIPCSKAKCLMIPQASHVVDNVIRKKVDRDKGNLCFHFCVR